MRVASGAAPLGPPAQRPPKDACAATPAPPPAPPPVEHEEQHEHDPGQRRQPAPAPDASAHPNGHPAAGAAAAEVAPRRRRRRSRPSAGESKAASPARPEQRHAAPSRKRRCLDSQQNLVLVDLLTMPCAVPGTGGFAPLKIIPLQLLLLIRERMHASPHLSFTDCRIMGSAASYLLGRREDLTFNDIDFLFPLEHSEAVTEHQAFDEIRDIVLCCLSQLLPSEAQGVDPAALVTGYMNKMFKVPSGAPTQPADPGQQPDSWSLMSLNSSDRRALEFKFVKSLKRQYEFSVDSLQIVIGDELLGSLSKLPDFTDASKVLGCLDTDTAEESAVMIASTFGDVDDVLRHLEHRIIRTNNPEEIRGGGLLKYCYLIAKGYQNGSGVDVEKLERYMCNRFLIDHSSNEAQYAVLVNYFWFRLSHQNERCIHALRHLDELLARCHSQRETIQLTVAGLLMWLEAGYMAPEYAQRCSILPTPQASHTAPRTGRSRRYSQRSRGRLDSHSSSSQQDKSSVETSNDDRSERSSTPESTADSQASLVYDDGFCSAPELDTEENTLAPPRRASHGSSASARRARKKAFPSGGRHFPALTPLAPTQAPSGAHLEPPVSPGKLAFSQVVSQQSQA